MLNDVLNEGLVVLLTLLSFVLKISVINVSGIGFDVKRETKHLERVNSRVNK